VKILIDSDVLLDVALARPPHVEDSAKVLRWAESSGDAAVAWHSLANCAYLLKGSGRTFLGKLLQIVEVATVGDTDARRAMNLPIRDLEDAFQVAAAIAWGADCIVTRNLADYKTSPVRAVSPTMFLRQLKSV
jgi:predicted nucleic acid-binding protein